jgi:hypothetical protein
VLFKDVELQLGDDAAKLQAFGLPVSGSRTMPRAAHSAFRKLKFPQPCVALDGPVCRIYADRPAHCRDFDCALLKAVRSGQVKPAAALRTIRTTRQRADNVLHLLRVLGDTGEALALSLRFKRAKKRFEGRPPDDEIAETFSRLTLAVHDLNLLLREAFYPAPGD